jgi:hypothetical protein
MKHVIAVLLAIGSLYAVFAERPAVADIGSCYSVRPICIQGQPVCLCTYTQNCFWACR